MADNQIRYVDGLTSGPVAIDVLNASVVRGNTLYGAPGDGISARNGCLIEGNTVWQAGRATAAGAGIGVGFRCTAEGNTIVGCDIGVQSGGGAVIVRNALGGELGRDVGGCDGHRRPGGERRERGLNDQSPGQHRAVGAGAAGAAGCSLPRATSCSTPG